MSESTAEKKTYKVEYNEKTQKFHLSEKGQEFVEDGEIWETIHENATEEEFTILVAFIEAHQQEKVTTEDVKNYLIALSNFVKLLVTAGITFAFTGNEEQVKAALDKIAEVESKEG